MYIDIAFVALALLAIKSGYSNGFLATIFRTLGYIIGGIAGLYFSLQLVSGWVNLTKQIAVVLLAIFLSAQLGLFVFGKAAKFFHARILWKPFRVIDSFAGVALEVIRLAVFGYLVLSTMLWSPWSPAKTEINDSQVYVQLDQHLPSVVTDLKDRANKLLNLHP